MQLDVKVLNKPENHSAYSQLYLLESQCTATETNKNHTGGYYSKS